MITTFSDPNESEAPEPEELDLAHENLSSGVQEVSFLGPQAGKSSKEIVAVILSLHSRKCGQGSLGSRRFPA